MSCRFNCQSSHPADLYFLSPTSPGKAQYIAYLRVGPKGDDPAQSNGKFAARNAARVQGFEVRRPFGD